MTVFVGTSGWQYRDWRGAFYPPKVAQRRWLPHYAEHFQVVEVNNSFYQLPTAETVRRWRHETPDDFIFVLKMNRYLTHIKRLKEPTEAVQRFVDVARELGPKLGPVLVQLPPNMKQDLGRLGETLDAMPRGIRVAVEFRHDSWYTAETNHVLSEMHAACCIADRKEKMSGPLWRTTDWGYVRLHEGHGSPKPCYTRAARRRWADRIASSWSHDSDVFVFFNNDAHACAVEDARALGELLKKEGLAVSRTPDRAPVRESETAA